jgi:hypothetical protein
MPTTTADEQTLVLLQPQADGLKETKQNLATTIKGGTIVPDARFGHAVELGDAEGNGITVPDGGKMDFSRGLTLEAWVYLTPPDDKKPHPGGTLFQKIGSFSFNLKDDKLNNAWMVFPSEPVATSTDKQFKYYPVESETFYGSMQIAPHRWTHLAITYDPVVKVIRTWIDGSLDRTRYLWREGDVPLQVDSRGALSIATGMKNLRLGPIRVSGVARPINDVPPLEAFVNALPYRKQVAVSLDYINPAQLPLDIVIQWENPNGSSTVLQRFPLTDARRKDVVITPTGWKALYTMTVKAFKNNHEEYSRSVRVLNGDSTKEPVRIDEQNRLIMNERPVFPFMMYHAYAEDFSQLAKMGFNIITPRAPNSAYMGMSPGSDAEIATARQYLDAAKAAGTTLSMSGRDALLRGVMALKDHPGLAIWYGADEPWGRLERLRDSYNAVKQVAPERPIINVQNNLTRLQETAEGADIIGCDPYPIPNVSLRYVADATKVTVRSVGGLKPVWTVIPQYETKLPTVEELRCMAYLAIASGANGLGIYAWDDRSPKTQKGWYTKENPEDVKVLSTVMSELVKLEDVLLIPNSTRAATFAPENAALHVALKEGEKDSYLMVVNDSRVVEEATLSIDGLQSADGVSTQDANDKLSIRGGKVLVQLPPLGAKLFKLSNVRKN